MNISRDRINQSEQTIKAAGLTPDTTGIKELSTQASKASVSMDTIAASSAASNQSIAAISSSGALAESSIQGLNGTVARTAQSADAATQAMNRLAAAASRALAAARAASAAGGQFAKTGGKVKYKAQGGPTTRGVDTQLTALQPGEFIVNAKSTRKFAAQLQAINAGQTPQFRESGGTVTNIGDINVSVQTDSTRDVSGKDLANSLRRELRRNTSSI